MYNRQKFYHRDHMQENINSQNHTHCQNMPYKDMSYKNRYIVVVLYWIISVVLLLLLPIATVSPPEGVGWYSAPWLAPLIGISIMCIGFSMYLWYHKNIYKKNISIYAISDIVRFAPVFKISVLFILYILSIVYLGYFVSTLTFSFICLYHTGLCGKKYVVLSVLFTITVIVIFRVALKIWLPTPEWYGVLPDVLSAFFMRYL